MLAWVLLKTINLYCTRIYWESSWHSMSPMTLSWIQGVCWVPVGMFTIIQGCIPYFEVLHICFGAKLICKSKQNDLSHCFIAVDRWWASEEGKGWSQDETLELLFTVREVWSSLPDVNWDVVRCLYKCTFSANVFFYKCC